MVEVQESSEPPLALDRAVVVLGDGSGPDEPVVQSLVMTLSVMMLDKLSNDQPEMLFPERDDVVETFASNGANEALGESVEIGTARRQLDHVHVCAPQDGGEVLGEEWVAVVDEVAVLAQEAVDGVGEVAGKLFEELSVRLVRDVGDLDSLRFEIDDEKDEIANKPGAREDLDGEEVGRGDGSTEA